MGQNRPKVRGARAGGLPGALPPPPALLPGHGLPPGRAQSTPLRPLSPLPPIAAYCPLPPPHGPALFPRPAPPHFNGPADPSWVQSQGSGFTEANPAPTLPAGARTLTGEKIPGPRAPRARHSPTCRSQRCPGGLCAGVSGSGAGVGRARGEFPLEKRQAGAQEALMQVPDPGKQQRLSPGSQITRKQQRPGQSYAVSTCLCPPRLLLSAAAAPSCALSTSPDVAALTGPGGSLRLEAQDKKKGTVKETAEEGSKLQAAMNYKTTSLA
ncbi:transcription initiation factor TFIID subunit 4-like isoform X2 [Chelonia mydas]|uniref:transcription initiation factor TFIID subunit 4-like isoform X2 n=1 Tax=Chelonia mydas TaxID=8469 RepID=UPI001CAA31C1|nr:transcription initiation factor TFIID subunit 4-like isoform X2 [Chelonia mydas]